MIGLVLVGSLAAITVGAALAVVLVIAVAEWLPEAE